MGHETYTLYALKHGLMYVTVHTLLQGDNEQRNSGHKSNSRVMQYEYPPTSMKRYTILHQNRPHDLAVLDQLSLIYSHIKYVY
jgi:hypothetical protein